MHKIPTLCTIVSFDSYVVHHDFLPAAALNLRICSTRSDQEAAATWGTAAARHTYSLVQEDEELSPALLLALIKSRPLVTPAWAEAAATGRKAWPEELFQCTVTQHRPARLRVPPRKAEQGAGDEGQESSWLVLSEWPERKDEWIAALVPQWEGSPGLLWEYLLVFEQQVGLCGCAMGFGGGGCCRAVGCEVHGTGRA